jgi:hypothetical protein
MLAWRFASLALYVNACHFRATNPWAPLRLQITRYAVRSTPIFPNIAARPFNRRALILTTCRTSDGTYLQRLASDAGFGYDAGQLGRDAVPIRSS